YWTCASMAAPWIRLLTSSLDGHLFAVIVGSAAGKQWRIPKSIAAARTNNVRIQTARRRGGTGAKKSLRGPHRNRPRFLHAGDHDRWARSTHRRIGLFVH